LRERIIKVAVEAVVDKFAQVLTRYSLALKPGDQLRIETDPEAAGFTLAVYREALKAGAFVFINCKLPGQDEVFYTYANDEQLDHPSSVSLFMAKTFDAILVINTVQNASLVHGVDPDRIRRCKEASGETLKILGHRIGRKELKWCYTVYPTEALAQVARMKLPAYEKFAFRACKLWDADPAESWRQEARHQKTLTERLHGAGKIQLRGTDIDLSLSVKGRRFLVSDGKLNMPDGEIFTSPVECSANGWVRYRYPACFEGCEFEGVQLWFKDGEVVKIRAEIGESHLKAMLDSVSGARTLGELGIGTNYAIDRFTRNMLFDEKMGGTIHLALGRGFPEAGGRNESAIHWDMLCNMTDGEIVVDGETLYRNGLFIR
jgi:aminopeptidase